MDEVAVLHAGLHLLLGLTPILFALQLALGRYYGFDKGAFGCLVELEVETFHLNVTEAERISEIKERTCVATGPLEIIKDANKLLVGLCINKGKQSLHAGTLHVIATAGEGVRKDRRYFQTHNGSALATTRFLRFKSVAVSLLSD